MCRHLKRFFSRRWADDTPAAWQSFEPVEESGLPPWSGSRAEPHMHQDKWGLEKITLPSARIGTIHRRDAPLRITRLGRLARVIGPAARRPRSRRAGPNPWCRGTPAG